MKFNDKLKQSVRQAESVLCVGIDPNPDLFPEPITSSSKTTAGKVLAFCAGVIRATQDSACAYKINTAYFEVLGKTGFDILGRVRELIPPGIITIADAKRGDVGHTAEQYKKAFFDVFDFDSITLSPLPGMDSLTPYLQSEEKGIFALTLTSNPGAADFFLKPAGGASSLSSYIASRLREESLRSKASIGMVIGATQDAAAGEVLEAFPEANLLIPGIGAQGGSVEKLQSVLKSHQGIPLVSMSRSLLYPASQDDLTWEQSIEQQALHYKQELNTISRQYV